MPYVRAVCVCVYFSCQMNPKPFSELIKAIYNEHACHVMTVLIHMDHLNIMTYDFLFFSFPIAINATLNLIGGFLPKGWSMLDI